MAGVTSTGFETKTFDEIETEISTRATSPEYYGEAFPTTPDSIFGILAGIISASLKDQYDLSKAVASQGNVDEASGKYLDDLAALNGVARLDAAPSTGSLVYTASDGTTVPESTPVRFTQTKQVTLATESTLITTAQCYRLAITVPDAVNGRSYIFRINSSQYFVIGSSSSTITSLRDGLVSVVNTADKGLTATPVGIDTLLIEFAEYRNGITLNSISNLLVTAVSGIVKYQAVEDGSLNFFANSPVSLVGTVNGVTSVENLIDWSLGRVVETDEELRIRLADKPNIIGTATKPSIESRINNLEGVISTLLVENTSMVVDSNGIPPKSYELFVEGGDDDVIAEEVWTTKPSGVATHGGVSKVIIDENGDEQAVSFSRFETKYGWVRVAYQLDTESTFPLNGEDLIVQTVTDTGNSFQRGQDLESTRFFGDLYKNVEGIIVVVVDTAITDLPTDTPIFNSNRKPVDDTVKILFDLSRSSTYLQ